MLNNDQIQTFRSLKGKSEKEILESLLRINNDLSYIYQTSKTTGVRIPDKVRNSFIISPDIV